MIYVSYLHFTAITFLCGICETATLMTAARSEGGRNLPSASRRCGYKADSHGPDTSPNPCWNRGKLAIKRDTNGRRSTQSYAHHKDVRNSAGIAQRAARFAETGGLRHPGFAESPPREDGTAADSRTRQWALLAWRLASETVAVRSKHRTTTRHPATRSPPRARPASCFRCCRTIPFGTVAEIAADDALKTSMQSTKPSSPPDRGLHRNHRQAGAVTRLMKTTSNSGSRHPWPSSRRR